MTRKLEKKMFPDLSDPEFVFVHQKKINARSIAFLVVLTYRRGLNYDYYYRASENITSASRASENTTSASRGRLNNADSDTFPRNSSFYKAQVLVKS